MMCGIAGIFAADSGAAIDPRAIRRMTDALRHRGPDGQGMHLDPGIGLGHRRLAIIDPAGGHQPMYNEDGSIAIVFNGEIYDFAALRDELMALGHVFRNRCDTETIIHAWESWGVRCVDRLEGQFAFALWDRRAGQLFCARDRLGKKPFYYAMVNGDFIFGSELCALATHAGLDRRIEPRAVDNFFAYGYVPEPATIFAGVNKLPAGHSMIIERDASGRRIAPLRPCRYWQPPAAGVRMTEAEAVPALRTHLTQATARRLVADVPLGAFLSGGVDSSAVVAAAAPLRRDPLDTFTIGFDGAEDETPYAQAVAARYGTRQHVERAAATDMIAAARTQAVVFGEPFGDASSVPSMAVCRLARRHATVAISGDGGDEVFGGYRRTRWHALVSGVRRHLPAGVRRHAIGRLAALYPKLDRAPRFLRARHTLSELSLDDALGYARMVTKMHARERRALFTPRLRAAIDGHAPFERIAAVMNEAEDADPVLQAQLADIATWLPGDILQKIDRASMAASLEVRAPFLDTAFLEFGLRLPASLKIRGGAGKYVLKKALEPLLPHDILYRPKQGFTSDLAGLFRRDMARVRAILLGDSFLAHDLFEADAVGKILDEHASGAVNHAQAIWLMLAFEGFLHALDAQPSVADSAAVVHAG
jgi:asparagine synthase (glutamine-hydrolysing)